MTPAPHHDPDRDPHRPKWRFSIWSVLAPAALLLVVIMVFNALGESGLIDRGEDAEQVAAATTAGAEQKPQRGQKPKRKKKRHVVKEGDTAQSIAAKYGLTEDELRKCNPGVADFYILQIGQNLHIAEDRCKEKPAE